MSLYFRKSSLILCGSAAMAIFTSSVCFRMPRSQAQTTTRRQIARDSFPILSLSTFESKDADQLISGSTDEQTLGTIDRIIQQKQGFLNETNANIGVQLEFETQCQNHIDVLTDGVNNDGLQEIEVRIIQTKPLIDRLKCSISESENRIAILSLSADNLERRIIELMQQKTFELQPDPSRTLRLKKQYDFAQSDKLINASPDDPLLSEVLVSVADRKSEFQKMILPQEAQLLNEAADQAVEASQWEDSEYERYTRSRHSDKTTLLRDDYIAAIEESKRLDLDRRTNK